MTKVIKPKLSEVDKEWLKFYGKCMFKTTWEHLLPEPHNFIHLHSSRRMLDYIHETLNEIEETGTTKNIGIMSLLAGNSEKWTQIIDTFSSSFYLVEGASTENDSKWVASMLARQQLNGQPLNKEVADEWFKRVSTYGKEQHKPHAKTLEQTLGLKRWKREHKSPVLIPDCVFNICELILEGDISDVPLPLDEACRFYVEKLYDKWEAEERENPKGIFSDNKFDDRGFVSGKYEGWIEFKIANPNYKFPAYILSADRVEKLFNEFKYQVLHEYLFDNAVIGKCPFFLSDEQREIIKTKYWKIELPEWLGTLSRCPNKYQKSSNGNQQISVSINQ